MDNWLLLIRAIDTKIIVEALYTTLERRRKMAISWDKLFNWWARRLLRNLVLLEKFLETSEVNQVGWLKELEDRDRMRLLRAIMWQMRLDLALVALLSAIIIKILS